MRSKYIVLFLLPIALLIACSDEVDKSPELSKEMEQFPGLSIRIPYFMERLHSNRWQVRSCLLDDLKGRDAETKRVFEIYINDENKRVAEKAHMAYLGFIDIDKTLFRPELYFRSIVGGRCFDGGIPDEDQYDAYVDNCVRSLNSAKLEDHSIDRTLTLVGIIGKPGDAGTLYRFLQSPDDNIAYNAAIAVIRFGDRERGIETLRRLARWDPTEDIPYMYYALIALKELQDPELETIVMEALASRSIEVMGILLRSALSSCWPRMLQAKIFGTLGSRG